MVILDYRDARPIYTQICDGIREQILSGILRCDDKLPSVRELATQLTINPNTIQRAYRELEMEGWIVSVAGKGSFVCGVPAGKGSQTGLEEFDRLVEALLAKGITVQQLQERIQQGGNEHA